MYKVSVKDIENSKYGHEVVWRNGSPENAWIRVYVEGIKSILNYLSGEEGYKVSQYRIDMSQEDTNIYLHVDCMGPADGKFVYERAIVIDANGNVKLGKREQDPDELWNTIVDFLKVLRDMMGDSSGLTIEVLDPKWRGCCDACWTAFDGGLLLEVF